MFASCPFSSFYRLLPCSRSSLVPRALGLIPERPPCSSGLMIQTVAMQSLGVAQGPEHVTLTDLLCFTVKTNEVRNQFIPTMLMYPGVCGCIL